jgi:hypothetical protein
MCCVCVCVLVCTADGKDYSAYFVVFRKQKPCLDAHAKPDFMFLVQMAFIDVPNKKTYVTSQVEKRSLPFFKVRVAVEVASFRCALCVSVCVLGAVA